MRATLALVVLALVAFALPAAAATPPNDGARFYTVVASDRDPEALVAHMSLGEVPDAYREILFWNPQLHNVYDLRPGQVLRRPQPGARPAFPAYDGDYSHWRVIAWQTTRFVGSPDYRVHNIVTAANRVNNFFDDWRHPYIAPRDSLSLDWLLGDVSLENGYVWGHAILVVDGVAHDIPAIGGGICQLPSTIFPAVLSAGIDVTRRVNHSYYPYFWWGYPEGFGIDATVDPPDGADLVMRNLYDYPIRLFMRADLEAQTLTAEVWAPPQLRVYPTVIDGPYLIANGEYIPAADAGWVWWASATVVWQRTYVDGGMWERAFWSAYLVDPYF